MTSTDPTDPVPSARLRMLGDLVDALPAGWAPGRFQMACTSHAWPLSLIDWACWLWAPAASLPLRDAARALGLPTERLAHRQLLCPNLPEARYWAQVGDHGYISPRMAALACRNVARHGVPNWRAQARWAGEMNDDAPANPAPARDPEIERLELVAEGIPDQHPNMGRAIAAIVQWSVADHQGWGGCRVVSCDPVLGTVLYLAGVGVETTVPALLAGGGRAFPTPDTAVDGLARVWADGRIECRLHSDMPIQGRA